MVSIGLDLEVHTQRGTAYRVQSSVADLTLDVSHGERAGSHAMEF